MRCKIGSEEVSLVRFAVGNFFGVLINTKPFYPITTLLIKLVKALIKSEPEPDERIIERIEWIAEHTHDEVDEHISVIELAVFKNIDRGLNREIEIGQKDYSLVQLYRYLDEITTELTEIVIEIAKKYSIDMPMQHFNMSASSSSQEIKV